MKFRNEYAFLSNMYEFKKVKVSFGDSAKTYTFTNAEAMFQASKNEDYARMFENLNGFEAKRLGRKIPLLDKERWNKSDRLYAMAFTLYIKFSEHPDLMLKLKSIKDEIVEDNTWNDRFWGRCEGIGENILGKMLMVIRDSNCNIKELLKFVDSIIK